jgi:hypothetical protein
VTWFIGHRVLDRISTHHSSADRSRAFANLFSSSVRGCGKVISIDATEALVKPGITLYQFGKRVFEELRDVLEAFMAKTIFVQVGELLLDAEIA